MSDNQDFLAVSIQEGGNFVVMANGDTARVIGIGYSVEDEDRETPLVVYRAPDRTLYATPLDDLDETTVH